jgi:Nucleic-acid-binding protein possibly involved in ribosomal biogenesis
MNTGTTTTPYYYRRRTIGRAASPPTWACYEQIPYNEDDCSDSESESCSEDGEDYSRVAGPDSSDSENSDHIVNRSEEHDETHDMHIEIDEVVDGATKKPADSQKDVKGKQRAIEPVPETTKQRRRKLRDHADTLRPILTIQKSQGFVWNQVSIFNSLRSLANLQGLLGFVHSSVHQRQMFVLCLYQCCLLHLTYFINDPFNMQMWPRPLPRAPAVSSQL